MDLDREWTLFGPAELKITLDAVAKLLNYQDADSIRDLVAEGKLPRPKGIGTAQYYSGLDVAVILEYFGRWQPATPRGGKTGEGGAKRGKAGENVAESES